MAWSKKNYVDFFVDELLEYFEFNPVTTKDDIELYSWDYIHEICDRQAECYYSQCIAQLKDLEYYDWSNFEFGADNIHQVVYAAYYEGADNYYTEIIRKVCRKLGIK
jgi:hypothetical protein